MYAVRHHGEGFGAGLDAEATWVRLVKPEVSQVTDELRYVWADAQVQLVFRGLHPTDSGNWRGMLVGESTDPRDRRNGGGHLIFQNVTITTSADRAKIAAKLQQRVARGKDEWEQDIDRVFFDAYRRMASVPDPVDLADVALESLDTRFLFDPILPQAQITLFLADQGSTKSYLMLYLALCTALGIPSVFGPPAIRGPAIYFDWEVDVQVARRRLGLMCRGLGIEVPRGLHYVNMSERGRLLDAVRDMRQQIERLGAVLAVVDSLTFATGGDLNNPEFAAPTMSAIGSLGAGVTKLVSSHPNKRDRNAEADAISVIGSGLFEFRARAIWHMKREAHRSSNFMVKLSVRKPFDGAPEQPVAYRVRFDNDAKAVCFQAANVSESPEFGGAGVTAQARIRHALKHMGNLDTTRLAELLGIDAKNIKAECNSMPDVVPVIAGGGRGKATVWGLAEPNEAPAYYWTDREDED